MNSLQVTLKNIPSIEQKVNNMPSGELSFKQKQQIRELVSPLAIVMASPMLPIYEKVEKILKKVDEFADDCPTCLEKACFAIKKPMERGKLISCGHMMHSSCIQNLKTIDCDDHGCKDNMWKDMFTTYTKKCPICAEEFDWSKI